MKFRHLEKHEMVNQNIKLAEDYNHLTSQKTADINRGKSLKECDWYAIMVMKNQQNPQINKSTKSVEKNSPVWDQINK